MKLLKIFLLLSIVFIINGCATDRTNAPPQATLTAFAPSLEVRSLWSHNSGNGTNLQYLNLTPALLDGRIYVVNRNGKIAAYDSQTGRRIWQTNSNQPITSGPAVGQGLVFIGTGAGQLFAYNAASGQFAWRIPVNSEVLAAPQVAGNLVLLKTEDDTLTALNASNGQALWSYSQPVPPLILRASSSAVAADGLIFAGFATGQLAALNPQNGTPIWQQQIAQARGSSAIEQMIDISADPVVVGNTVYAATYQGKIAALNVNTGEVKWQDNLSVYTGLAYKDQVVYATDASGWVWAFAADSGRVLWKQDGLFGRYLSAPAVMDNAIVVADAGGYVHFLSPQDGHFIARIQATKNSGIIATPLVDGNLVYVYTNAGRLIAYQVQPLR